jgi:hypothetical protein
MMSQMFLIISFACIASNYNQVSFAQLNAQAGVEAQVEAHAGMFASIRRAVMGAPKAVPTADLGSAQLTMDSFVNQVGPNPIPYKTISSRILHQWNALKFQSAKLKSPLKSGKHNWPKWIIKKKEIGGLASNTFDLQASVEAIIRIGYWFYFNNHILPNSNMTFNEQTARECVRQFLLNFERTEGQMAQMASYNVLDARDQFLIKSTTVRIVLGDVEDYKKVRNIIGQEIAEPAATADTRIYKLEIDTVNYTANRWRRMDGAMGNLAAPPAAAIIGQLVTGFRPEAAFHITNGADKDDKVKRWQEINDPAVQTTELWAESKTEEANRSIKVHCEFKVNNSNVGPRQVVSRDSNTDKKWTQALERYLASWTFQRLTRHFVFLLYGTGAGGNLNTAASFAANSGTVHKLFTRHALSCANIAKTINEWRARLNRVLDFTVVPLIVRQAGIAVLKNIAFLDTKLTDLGVHNSVHGGYKLAEQCAANNIPAPRKAFTSTMQRTIETAHYMMDGMTAHANDNNLAPHGWGAFAALPKTIMPGIKEQGSGAENTPRGTLNALTNRLNADNQGNWAVNANTLDSTWITGHGSTWDDNNDTDSFSYFQEKLGDNLRADAGAVHPAGVGNIAEQSTLIVTHSRQMKSWFEAFVGGNKPDNNETWKFEYLRLPGLNRDHFVLLSQPPTNDNAAPALWRVGNYAGYRQRDPSAMDVAPAVVNHANAIAQEEVSSELCERCDNGFLNWYADTGM